ncbi:MAG: InlB B-repeat-containing protein, partial [Clostridia bacterium]|nr:InlB B-repeat-containing protein [Clostridia bacterium]
DGGDYTIGGDTVTPENNELTIADNYFGQTLEIGGTLSGVELTQSLEVPARPAAPADDTDYTLTQPTVYGAKGGLKATAADTLEYKIDNGEWTSLPTDEVEVDQGSTVQIRKSTTDSTFASEPTEQTINTIAQTFTVTWKNGSETLETDENVVDGAAPSYDGETPAKTATADKTYTFSGWRIADGNGEATGDLITPEQLASKKITADTTYIAQFTETARKYRITFVDEDGSTVLKAATEYEYGATVVEPETPTKSATAEYTYSFADWTPSVTTVTGDQTYTATFTESAREYNITYNLNGHGTALTGNNLKYTAGTAKELPALTDDNYNFGGWYEDNTTFNTAAQITAATRGDKTFYAKWTAKTYAVSAAAELTNGSVSVNKTTASLNDEITVTITPNTGYQLASLTIGGAAVTGEALTNAARSNSYTFSMPAKAVEVTATFEEIPVNTYTVTIICGDGIENVKLGTKTGSKDGNIYTFTEVEAGEYNFEVTYTEGYEKATVSPTSITVSESKTSETISAQKKKYTVTFKIEGRDDTEVQIEHGSTAQSQAPQNPTKSGYHFVGWVKGTDTTAAIITTWDAITSNGTIYTAKFEENAPDTVTVTFNAGDGTFDNAEKTKAVTINKGATLTANNLPSVTPPTGYTFNGWGDITGKAVNESVSYTAEYMIKSFTITWMLDESAKID